MKTSPDWKASIGHRVLLVIADGSAASAAYEAFVAEIAAKSGYVKLIPHGWCHPDKFAILETLSATSALDQSKALADELTVKAAGLVETNAGLQTQLGALAGALDEAMQAHAGAAAAINRHIETANKATAALDQERAAHAKTKHAKASP